MRHWSTQEPTLPAGHDTRDPNLSDRNQSNSETLTDALRCSEFFRILSLTLGIEPLLIIGIFLGSSRAVRGFPTLPTGRLGKYGSGS